MLRRLHTEQPNQFAFTPANLEWAKEQIAKYPSNRAQSAVIPLLWRAQEQEGWLSRPAIEAVSDMLGMAYMRALEVATFYFMFQLAPVGKTAHIQVCGTTSCMLMGSDDLIAVCKSKIAKGSHEISADGEFSWEEVECLGACTNAPMVQIGKDFYEDLTAEKLEEVLDAMKRGEVPVPGPQNGRFAAEPLSGRTSLTDAQLTTHSASATLALENGDSIARIVAPGAVSPMPTSVDLAVSRPQADPNAPKVKAVKKASTKAAKSVSKAEEKPAKTPPKKATSKPATVVETPTEAPGKAPETLTAARDGKADDLKLIKGVGPKLMGLLNKLGFYHFDQIGSWSEEEIDYVDHHLEGFKGRIRRDEWQDQAKLLAKGELTKFAKRHK